ncbi:hypothetical protein K1T71_000237 [Dendrolimus kikuchii]|uniref:Uncharacterized protein n=1 Tax=Dendrolimus kikuchii TaxID=765133 RepID=A0ACC1DIK5_9NEOP|nr:hypothetical protein K1T71_000237 [Dendrolimus kikuchii]
MTKQDDGLFLLEVLIDKIVFVKSPCFSDKDFRTCVNIEAPAVEPLEICDDDPGACVAKSGGPFVKTFNSGKSCLFSLKESDITKAMSTFPIKVSVYKSLPCGCLPTKIVMGEATIDMTKEFVQARKKFLDDPNTVSYQALKDSFRIVEPGGAETGEIVMFLRISCFGKLIITRFQGGSGPPNLGAGSGVGTVVDRSCNPKKDFQTTQDPCACGAARGVNGEVNEGGMGGQPCTARGVCPPARDPYNSMPCEDPDDPCYCSGPKPSAKQQMSCRNTDPYCLHIPKELTEDQILDIKLLNNEIDKLRPVPCAERKELTQTIYILDNNIKSIDDCNNTVSNSLFGNVYSATSVITLKANESKITWSGRSDIISKGDLSYSLNNYDAKTFAHQETAVYMTLFNNFGHCRSSGTQATASINKCLQVHPDSNLDTRYAVSTVGGTTSNYSSSCTMPVIRDSKRYMGGNWRSSEVYFWGRKNDESNEKAKKPGMGKSDSKSKVHKSEKVTAAPVKNVKVTKGSASVQAKSLSNSTGAQTGKSRGASASTSTAKSVSIKDDKQERPCPAGPGTKEDMIATVTHIRIGPKEPCPTYGKDPCQGPKCKAASAGEEKAPVKITTVTNPRRGVFELVIRRLTGAPLAKNELMLEWTPPPSRPQPCGAPFPVPCAIPVPCRPSKCKMIVCRPVPCKPKCCKRGCKKPCGPTPCRNIPCKNCCKSSCCGKSCRPCMPCPPPLRCKPCPPIPCCASPCSTPCKSSPCLRPCPVGRRRPRRSRSQPRIKAHRKRTSPCCNRSKICPVVQCRSVPGPCIACCRVPPCPWPPRKCCSAAPCKPPKCSKSNCSTCC